MLQNVALTVLGTQASGAGKERRFFAAECDQASVSRAMKATLCSKTGPFFSCESNKLCFDSIEWRPHLGKWSPPRSANAHFTKEFDVANSGLGFQIRKWRLGWRMLDPDTREPGSFTQNMDPRVLVCAQEVGAAFCNKTAPFLSCAPKKPPGGLQHILRKEFDVANSGLGFQIPKWRLGWRILVPGS